MNVSSVVTFTQGDWDVYARCYDTLLRLTPYQSLRDEVVACVQPNATDVILDAGCGTGNLLGAMHHMCREARLCGVDLSTSMLVLAQMKIKDEKNVALARASLNEPLPFQDGMFSKIASMNVLYAVPDPLRTLRELFRLLVCGGTFVLVTPKRGYDNGHILKEHAHSVQPDEYWEDAHASPEREECLIREAIHDELLVQAMLHIAHHNRLIAQNAIFHFFTEDELCALIDESGFAIQSLTQTYAKQAFIVVATKKEMS